ncbi:MAG TPA: hypothetical protein PLQ54_18780, partial [Armatimonadota bacterium]|nr:hypothetical protein [Armatimonadota bacterium]
MKHWRNFLCVALLAGLPSARAGAQAEGGRQSAAEVEDLLRQVHAVRLLVQMQPTAAQRAALRRKAEDIGPKMRAIEARHDQQLTDAVPALRELLRAYQSGDLERADRRFDSVRERLEAAEQEAEAGVESLREEAASAYAVLTDIQRCDCFGEFVPERTARQRVDELSRIPQAERGKSIDEITDALVDQATAEDEAGNVVAPDRAQVRAILLESAALSPAELQARASGFVSR